MDGNVSQVKQEATHQHRCHSTSFSLFLSLPLSLSLSLFSPLFLSSTFSHLPAAADPFRQYWILPFGVSKGITTTRIIFQNHDLNLCPSSNWSNDNFDHVHQSHRGLHSVLTVSDILCRRFIKFPWYKYNIYLFIQHPSSPPWPPLLLLLLLLLLLPPPSQLNQQYKIKLNQNGMISRRRSTGVCS